MTNFATFERIARDSIKLQQLATPDGSTLLQRPQMEHPFESRNVHPDLPRKVRNLFNDGHFAEATFEACKFLDYFVGKHIAKSKSGEARMTEAFKEQSPLIRLNALDTDSAVDEQRGYKFLFAGTMVAIRNPRGHQHSVEDDPDTCLDHLGLVSTLLRRLNQAGYV